MTAKQAYCQTMRNIKSQKVLEQIDAKDEFDKVLRLIREAVSGGQMRLYVDFELKPGTISLLRENGYEVCNVGNNRISWRNKKSFLEKFWEYIL